MNELPVILPALPEIFMACAAMALMMVAFAWPAQLGALSFLCLSL